MSVRPVYTVNEMIPFFGKTEVEFKWNGGLAKSQKQKNICAIHEGFNKHDPEKKVLEISSKSMQQNGEQLSAFVLKKYVASLDKWIPVECVYQAGKVFEQGGPYLDLLEKTSREAKRDERLKNSGRLIRFEFEGKRYPLIPKTIFYDFIYMNALLENPSLAEEVLKYDAFTDIEFNPKKNINCQAKAAATFVSLYRSGLIDKVKEFDRFLELYGMQFEGISQKKKTVEKAEQKLVETDSLSITEGTKIKHRIYGIGEVIEVNETVVKVIFSSKGEKMLNLEWCMKNCQFL